MKRELTEHEVDVVRSLFEAKAEFRSYAAFCTAAKEVVLTKWNGIHPVEENTTEVKIPPGTPLKIVMVSRFGDIGLTDDLDADHGYSARLDPDDDRICDIRWTKEPRTQAVDPDDAWNEVIDRANET